MKTNFVNQEIYHESILAIMKSLKETQGNTEIIMHEDLHASTNQSYHFIANLLKSNSSDRIRRSICSLMFKDVYRAEILSARGGEVAFKFATEFAIKLLESKNQLKINNQQELLRQWEVALEKTKKIVEKSSCHPTKPELEILIQDLCQDNELGTACIEAINLAGLEGKIFIEDGKQPFYSVELKTGFSFNLNPYFPFLESGSWERKEVKALVVDGFVEAVSEIDQLLIESHEKKQPMIIIAHGFSEEVFSTLYTNFKKGALDILPIRIKSDVNSINLVNDIGVVCGMDPITSLKGQQLTFVKYDNLPVVDSVRITSKKTSIENEKVKNAVASQIAMLIGKRDEKQAVDDLQLLLEERIKNLSPNSVVLKLPESSSVDADSKKIKIDHALRLCKTVLNYGVVEMTKVYETILLNEISDTYSTFENIPIAENFLEQLVFETLVKASYSSSSSLELDLYPYPALSFYVGIMLAGKTILMALSSSGFVKIDESP